MNKKVYIIMPAFNEAKRIGFVLSELKKAGYKNIVVVDDGSSDKTLNIAKKAGVYALSHIMNRGQGASLQTGIDFALSKGADIIVTYDADGQFVIKEIESIIEPIKKGEADVALGSRFLGKAKNIPLSKKIVLKLGVFVVFILYGIKITDSQCGFRALSGNAAEKIHISYDRMEHAAEFFLEIMRNNLKYKEVPITVIYDDYSLEKGQDWSRSFDLGIKMLIKKFMR
jgi:glycosyltransferase involved in cell wall biosynthesis